MFNLIRRRCLFFLFIIYLFINPVFAEEDNFKGPLSKQQNGKQEYITSTSSLIALQAIRFFSKVISPADGPRSPSYPTGSAYGYQAVKKKGVILGIILTADRLFHETDKNLNPLVTIGGKNRYYDPVENNTFWWDSKEN